MMLPKNIVLLLCVCLVLAITLSSCNTQGASQTDADIVSSVVTDAFAAVTDADIDDVSVFMPIDTEYVDAEADGGEIAPSNDRVRLVMVGDILMHDPVLESGKTLSGYSFDHLFENVKDDVSAADIAIFNQEVIIAGEKYGINGYPKFNAPFELADSIAQAGFDVALHATNHTLDAGIDAMLECLDYWQTKHPLIEVVGMHDTSADAENISVIEKNGIRIAILNYTDNMNPAGEQPLRDYPYLVDMLTERRLKRDVRAARQISDFVVVCVHWGSEYAQQPTIEQRRWASIMHECGVDLVLGTHPHVIQPIQWLETKDGRKMLVYWSLGNFVNCTAERGAGKGARMLGIMADVLIEKNREGNVEVALADAVPLITHIEQKNYGITTYKFSDYSEEMLRKNETMNIDPSFSYEYCTKTFSEILASFKKQ